ncbi:MAG: Gfo/Idh/MocA family oxidoreductase [Candidatus Xenobia bacterium]
MALKVALLGYGISGAVYHAPIIAAVPGLQLKAVMTSSPERRLRLSQDFPDVAVIDSVSEALALGCEIIVVCSPNHLHVPHTLAALEGCRCVVVEKPLAITWKEARLLVARATSAGTLLVPYHNRRWDGDFLTVSRLVRSGRLGRLLRFSSRFERYRPVRPQAWREEPAARGGGVLLDLGPHLVDQAIVLFGMPQAVYAEIGRLRVGAEAEDDVLLALHYPDNLIVRCSMSVAAWLPGARFTLVGSDAAYEKRGVDPQEAALRAGVRPGGPSWGCEPEENWGVLVRGAQRETFEPDPGSYQEFYLRLRDCLDGNSSPPVAAQAALNVLQIIEAARESAQQARLVYVCPPSTATMEPTM